MACWCPFVRLRDAELVRLHCHFISGLYARMAGECDNILSSWVGECDAAAVLGRRRDKAKIINM
jgi:hypothetical protein